MAGVVRVIQVVHGIPGTGKDYYVATRIRKALKSGRRVYCNSAFEGCRPLVSIVDAVMDPFEGALLVVTEAGAVFDARETIKNPLPKVAFTALTEHRHFGTDLLMNVQSLQFLDVQVRRVTQEYIIMSRLGADATARLLANKPCWIPYFQRPLLFRARCYGPDQFDKDMSLMGRPVPKWTTTHLFLPSVAGRFNTASRRYPPSIQAELARWQVGAEARASLAPWRVRKGVVEDRDPAEEWVFPLGADRLLL